MPNLAAWLGNGIAGREADTLREIAADPTEVTRVRDGAADAALTVRIVPGGLMARGRQSEVSAATVKPLSILAAAGTDLRRGDLLADGAGNVYRVTWVTPGQEWRVEAEAEVVG